MPAQNPVASRLSREVIVDAYLRLVEAEDNDSVSLRRLGGELGVDPTAVYRHFRDKDEILTAAADRLLAEVTDGVELSGGWRDQLRDLLLALRRVYLVHPRALLALQLSPPRLENGFGNVERDARATEESLAGWRQLYRMLPADRFPNLTATAASLYLDIDKAFRYGLDLMLDAIETRVRGA